MFNLFKTKPKVNTPSPLRETFFGDFELESLAAPAEDQDAAFTSLFAKANAALNNNDPQQAAMYLRQVTEMPELESRIYLAAWFHLGNLGIDPPPELAQKVLGVVLEVWMDKGLDVLAAYEDGTARYVNFTDAAVIWDAPGADARIEQSLRQLLDVGQAVAPKIGPWEGKGRRPAPPEYGQIRLNMLTPSGIHFGQGAYESLSADPMGNALIQAGIALMEALTEKQLKQG